jgi:hypothetical protein|tara:strand:+ start:1521 stop:1706 length:186 start_codon:yes stop_codon:yes gene_type:complete
MTLSTPVEDSLREAQSNLRNALAYAARTESPYTSKHIAEMLSKIEAIIDAEEFLTKIESDD